MARQYNMSEESRQRVIEMRKSRTPWNKGRTAETDERIRKNVERGANTRRKLHKEGKIKPWNLGKKIDRNTHPDMGHNTKHAPESIVKMKLARKGKSAHWNKGEKSPMWKGGVTPENKRLRGTTEFYSWREAVFTRDNWTCQKTKVRGGKLHPHHVLNFSQYPELRYDVNNGITVSEKAHREFHKKYGKNNNTREQLNEFLLDG